MKVKTHLDGKKFVRTFTSDPEVIKQQKRDAEAFEHMVENDPYLKENGVRLIGDIPLSAFNALTASAGITAHGDLPGNLAHGTQHEFYKEVLNSKVAKEMLGQDEVIKD